MKIGFFCVFFPEKHPFTKTKGFDYGGADESLYDLVKELYKLGHEIKVFSIGKGNKIQYESPSNGLELYRYPVAKVPIFKTFQGSKGFCSFKFLWLKKFNFDIIHAKLGNPPGGLAGLIYKRKYKCPMVLDIGGKQNPEWGNFFRKRSMNIYLKLFYPKILNAADAILVRSKEFILDDHTLLPYKDKIHIIHRGFDFDFFSTFNESDVKKRIKYNNKIKKTKKIIFFAGNLVESKGIHILIKAIGQIKDTHPDLILYIAGKGHMKKKLVSLVKDLELNDKIFFVGYLDKISLKELYYISDLFILPSMSEGFPRVLLESMATGTPCLVSDIGANKGALGDGKVGFTAKCFDIKDLANKINFFFNHDESWFKKESEKSKKYAKGFSWEKTAKEIEKIYEKLIDENK